MAGFIDFFRSIPDHRIEKRKLHGLEELLLVTFCRGIAGYDGGDDLELFGKTQLAYVRQHLPFKHRAPSDGMLRRFFRALDKEPILPNRFNRPAGGDRWPHQYRDE